MRHDMARVLVTRPRLGGKVRRKGRAYPMEDLPSRVGMKRGLALAKADKKTLNEHLQPLRRYLHGQVGRPWDKVWSDIAAGLRVTSTVQQHVRDHVFDFVAKDVFLRGGEPWLCEFGRERPLRDSYRELLGGPPKRHPAPQPASGNVASDVAATARTGRTRAAGTHGAGRRRRAVPPARGRCVVGSRSRSRCRSTRTGCRAGGGRRSLLRACGAAAGRALRPGWRVCGAQAAAFAPRGCAVGVAGVAGLIRIPRLRVEQVSKRYKT